MNNQLSIFTATKVMTSREIAELTGKRHDNVMRDIDTLVESISSELRNGFKSTTYTDGGGRSYRMFELDRDSTYCLVAGYDANARMRIIKRWQELEVNAVSLPSHGDSRLDAQKTFEAYFKVCQIIGLDPNASAVSASNAVVKELGINLLEAVGQQKLPSPSNSVTLTPTDIGKSIGMTPIAVNKKLEGLGLQDRVNNTWIPTEKGKRHGARVIDSSKRRSNGAMIQQLRWEQEIIKHISKGI